MSPTLLAIGAGPKSLSIHVKAKVLRELGRHAPNVIIIEKDQVGANWSGRSGYTDGKSEIATPPEKDIGFPYHSRFGHDVDLLSAQYSWTDFKIKSKTYAEWVDSGRPPISHAEFAAYLKWVAEKSSADIRIGHVNGPISIEGNDWVVPYYPPGYQHPVIIRANALLITGPGKPRALPGRQPRHPSITDGQSFWLPSVLEDFSNINGGDLAIIGDNYTAASVVETLLDILPNVNNTKIHIFSKSGDLNLQPDTGGEIRWSTNPPIHWNELSEAERLRQLRYAEKGGISASQITRIKMAPNVHIRSGLVWHAAMKGKYVRLTLNVADAKPRLKVLPEKFRRLILAIGNKHHNFRDLFHDKNQFPEPKLKLAGYDKEMHLLIARNIRSDLSYKNQDGWPNKPILFLPMLSGLACGPGFSNLRCLGHLSDRIVESCNGLPL